MSDLKEEFMAAALQSAAANPEKKLGLWRWLGEMIGTADEKALEEATGRWREVDAKNGGRSAGKIAFGLLASAAVFGVFLFPYLARDLRSLSAATGSGVGSGNALPRMIGKGLGAEDRLLLGDQALSSLQQKEALIASDPDNAAYFADYAVDFHQAHDRLPPDFLQTASRLDPDNAWFDYFAASVASDKAVESVKRTKEERDADAPFRWEVRQPEKVSQALELFRTAKGKTRFQNYEETLLRRRIPLLPQRNQIERLASVSYLSAQKDPQMEIMTLCDVISSQVWKAGEERNPELFRKASADASDLLRNLVKLEDISLIGELIHLAAASKISTNLDDAAKKLGLADEAEKWSAISIALKQYNKERRSRSRMNGDARRFMETGGMLISLAGPLSASQVKTPPLVTDADLKPARLMDHRLIGAASAGVLWILLAIACLALILHRFKGPEALRSLAVRGCQLLKVSDWLWVIVVGVLLPVAVVISISWFIPAGGSDLSIKMTMREPLVILPAAHYLALFLMLVILPVVIARWRLSIRAAAFGFAGLSWSGLAVVLGLVFYVIGYLYVHWIATNLALLLAASWLLVMGAFGLFGRSKGLLRRTMIGRVILPAYLLGMICMVAVSAVSMTSYQAWFKKDEFMRLTPDAPAMTPYEYRVAKQMREEIKAMLGTL